MKLFSSKSIRWALTATTLIAVILLVDNKSAQARVLNSTTTFHATGVIVGGLQMTTFGPSGQNNVVNLSTSTAFLNCHFAITISTPICGGSIMGVSVNNETIGRSTTTYQGNNFSVVLDGKAKCLQSSSGSSTSFQFSNITGTGQLSFSAIISGVLRAVVVSLSTP